MAQVPNHRLRAKGLGFGRSIDLHDVYDIRYQDPSGRELQKIVQPKNHHPEYFFARPPN